LKAERILEMNRDYKFQIKLPANDSDNINLANALDRLSFVNINDKIKTANGSVYTCTHKVNIEDEETVYLKMFFEKTGRCEPINVPVYTQMHYEFK
jgi:hypothetical protein